MRIFKTKEFDKLARRQHLTDQQLRKAVSEIEDGLVDADLVATFSKNVLHMVIRAKAARFEHCSLIDQGRKHSSCTASPRTKRTILLPQRSGR